MFNYVTSHVHILLSHVLRQVLIVGAGPCGLRMAIECALLGAKTVVLEARDYISRNNVLHLWPFVIQDIKRLGGKVLFRQFCTGGIDHISKSDLYKMAHNLHAAARNYTINAHLQSISPDAAICVMRE